MVDNQIEASKNRKKLALHHYHDVVLVNENEYSTELLALDVKRDFSWQQQYDCVLIHVFSIDEMKEQLYRLHEHQTLREGGLCYLLYPKLNNSIYPGIHRDHIFPALGVDDALGFLPGTAYKFNRMVSFNTIWTIIGIKHLTFKEQQRLMRQSDNRPSGRVSDYVQYESDLMQRLTLDENTRFKQLTPGRQRQWLRHLYSAKTQPTKDKRLNELKVNLLSDE
ncbi:YdeI/OmpD-associated family protein [Aerococcaceae bacterium zg-BR22]|uniref:YdeI/OmpD-associated family protein n=1 Tax=Aerococcaceae bacterium zg-1292 TaxID=2774330 RepID=UPI004063408D|nr:YdeI/OmpD-associated family protein [Aerococcaceae bacterium zg-BR22]